MVFTKKIRKIRKRTAKLLKKKELAIAALAPLALLFLFLLLVLATNLIYLGKVFPGVKVAGIDVGGKTTTQAIETLSKNINKPDAIVLIGDGRTFELKSDEIELSYDFEGTARRAHNLYRTGNLTYDYYHRAFLPFWSKNLGLSLTLNEEELQKHISIIAGQLSIEPVNPEVNISGEKVLVEKGEKGKSVKTNELRAKIGKSLAFAQNNEITIPIKEVDPTLTDKQLEILTKRAETLVGKSLTLSFEHQSFSYNDSELVNLINPDGEYKKEATEALLQDIAEQIERAPQNSVFVYRGNRVEEFAPAKDGVKIDRERFVKELTASIKTLEEGNQNSASMSVPVKKTKPAVSTDEVNDLGINELLGRGTSRFAGSITSRIHNIGVASSNFNGQLVKPGEVFSFNEILGDVSAYTGYKQAYIIKDGKTVLGDGGGVCQVSTTLFRAILDAGLPIVERSPHSYRVSYYEQDSPPGLDATIYSPYVDLKFKNDTPNHLLIQTEFNPGTASLVFEIYGTDDGRMAQTTKPVVAGVTAPPEDKYVDDPSLPAGEIKQIEHKAWGASVSFTYSVEKEGEVLYEKTFYSNYKPWQAVYLRGTGPVN